MPDESPGMKRPVTGGDAPASKGAEDVRARGVADTKAPGDDGNAGVAGSGRRARYLHRDLTTGSVPKHLAHLSWPQVLEGMIMVADQMVDLFWAGRLPAGFRAIAGLGIGQTFSHFGFSARHGLDQSLRAMVARAVGARNMPLANHIALQGFTLTALYSLTMVGIGLFLTEVFLGMIGASEAVQAQTAMYMRIQFIGLAVIGFRQTTTAALQASGEVIIPLKAVTVTRLIHVVLTPFLIFGWWWFPSLGLAGAALANVFAQLSGCAINFYALFRGTSRLHLTFRGYRLDLPILWRIVKIALPASIAATERAVSQLVLLRLVTPFGDGPTAAYALTRRMENFLNFGSQGVGQASGIMVGQNLGAGRPDRAIASIYWGLAYVQIVPLIVRAVMFVWPVILITIFTTQSDVVELSSPWLRLQVIAAFFLGTSNVFQQSFYGAGATLVPMVVTLVSVWLVEMPAAWILTLGVGVGPLGIGYAGIMGMALRCVLFLPYFLRGRWLKTEVL